jgi:hypothetical protein
MARAMSCTLWATASLSGNAPEAKTGSRRLNGILETHYRHHRPRRLGAGPACASHRISSFWAAPTMPGNADQPCNLCQSPLRTEWSSHSPLGEPPWTTGVSA